MYRKGVYMNIRLVGTGSIWAEDLSACALIDNTVLIDCPNGLVKALKKDKINIREINMCVITHFHADHYFDIPFLLLELGMKDVRKQNFIIIGPKGLKKRIDMLFSLAYPELWEKVRNDSKLQMIEITDEKKPVVCNDYTITPYKVIHEFYEAYGYTISTAGKIVGFTGDTLLCSNVEEIVQKSKITFADMSFETNSKAHMGVKNIVELKERYTNHIIVPTHMSEDARMAYNRLYGDAPADGTIFKL